MPHRLYVAGLLAVMILMLAYVAGQDLVGMVRNCGGKGYNSDSFLAGCESEYFGNYEHGAYYFQLEPEAVSALKTASVVVLGHSRPMFALGTQSTRSFFDSRKIRYYLLGFRFAEGEIFAKSILDRLDVRPRVLILNVDNWFFAGYQSVEAADIAPRKAHYIYKKFEQVTHKWICSIWDQSGNYGICPDKNSLFRNRLNGEWDFSRFHGKNATGHPFQYDYSIDQKLLDKQLKFGRFVLEHLDVRPECIILMTVPYPDAHLGTTLELANRLGVKAVVPRLEGLATWDDSHLSADSAEMYSQAFEREIETTVRACVG